MPTSLKSLISQYLPVALPFLILAAAILVVLLLGHLALRYPAWRKVFYHHQHPGQLASISVAPVFTLNFSTVASSIFSPLLLLAET